MAPELKVKEFMTPLEKLITAKKGITLTEANDIIWEYKLNSLPIVDENGCLDSFVFRKDYESSKEYPNQLQDENKLSELMITQEAIKTLPFGDVWAEYCRVCGVPADNYYDEIEAYEKDVLLKRN